MTLQLSPGTPEQVEQDLIASVTNQFNVTISTNPFFQFTYQAVLNGYNPLYNPPLTSQQLLNQINSDAQYITNVDSNTYPAGWADGMGYQQYLDNTQAGEFIDNCSSPTYFNLVNIDTQTCANVVSAFYEYIYSVHIGTPTAVPGDWQ